MEVVRGRSGKASKSAPIEDIIDSMPENVITNIMDCLPLQEAVKTSILSRNWRFKWTLRSQLVLDYDFFDFLLKGDAKHIDVNKIIGRLLLHHKGAITNFVLEIYHKDIKLDVEDINHWILFLSRIGGIKNFTLTNDFAKLKLPAQIFSCVKLQHLELRNCIFGPLPCFRGFPNLLSLTLDGVIIQGYKCGNLIARSPLLEKLSLYDLVGCEVKLVEIVNLENLRELDMPLHLLDDNMTMTRLSDIFHQLSLLPKLQHLDLYLWHCKFLSKGVAQQTWVSNTVFPCLKTLSLYGIDFSSDTMLSCVVGMLYAAPNLQTLDIVATYENIVPPPLIGFLEGDCSTIFGQLQLQDVDFNYIKGLENEVCLIKSMLACSPLLKTIYITANESIRNDANEKFKLSSKLLKLHRASPIAEIGFP